MQKYVILQPTHSLKKKWTYFVFAHCWNAASVELFIKVQETHILPKMDMQFQTFQNALKNSFVF